MRMHSTFICLVALGSVLSMAGCGSSTATTSSATATASTTATATTPSTTAVGSAGPAGSAAIETTTAGTGGAGTQPTTAQTASPGVTAPRGSIVAAPGRVVPVTDAATTAAGGAIDASLQKTIDLAVADLAAQLKVDASAITTVSAKSVEWPDKSDGCPQPGMSYPQIPVDGVFIVLSNKATTYEYHGGGSRTPFLCKKG